MQDSRVDPAHPLARLLAPGERLGWVFRDRRLARRAFGEPQPVPPPPRPPTALAFEAFNAETGRPLHLSSTAILNHFHES